MPSLQFLLNTIKTEIICIIRLINITPVGIIFHINNRLFIFTINIVIITITFFFCIDIG